MKPAFVFAALSSSACLVPASPPAPPPATAARVAPATPPAAPPPPATAANAADEAHDPQHWFPFPARGISAANGLVDLSQLNDVPAGSRGFIRATGGHFVDEAGRRVRFFGVDCTATACFPTHEVATRAAAHFRRLGINLVRFHFMDKGSAPIGLLIQKSDGLDPAQLDRLDFFVAELAKNGIYSNVNLHVARRYPGLEGAAAQRFEFGKMLDRFYPPFIESQKVYARALLAHVNAYTGRAYTAEPAVLCVEMNNENTALPFWAGNLDDLPEPYAGELKRQWNVWLRERYRSTARLRAAWSSDAKSAPKEILSNADLSAGTDGWTFESAGVPTHGEVVQIENGGRALRFSASQRGTASWHLQLYRAHLPLVEGESYHLSFRVRAPRGFVGPEGPIPPVRNLETLAMLAVPDWRNIGLYRMIAVTPEWQRIDVTFRPQGTIAGEGRLNFGLRNVPGVVELADLSLTAGVAPVKLGAGETLEQATIPLVHGENGSPAGEDFLRFLADTDRATAHTLATFIRKELGLRSLLVDTQASYGGLEGLRRELAESDFIDMHAYWQHPDFASGWSQLRFHIDNTTQVAAPDGGALGSLAVYRVGGKPFTVSEYNVPAPNDYASEALPMYASIAALQDWDAIYAYTYLDFSARWDADHLLGFFDLAGNPAALSFLPVAALTFRKGLVEPSPIVSRLTLPATHEKDSAAHRRGGAGQALDGAGRAAVPGLVEPPGGRSGQTPRKPDAQGPPGRAGELDPLEQRRARADLPGQGARLAGGRRKDRRHRFRHRRRPLHRRRSGARRRLHRAGGARRPSALGLEGDAAGRRGARREQRDEMERRAHGAHLLGTWSGGGRVRAAHGQPPWVAAARGAARSRGRRRGPARRHHGGRRTFERAPRPRAVALVSPAPLTLLRPPRQLVSRGARRALDLLADAFCAPRRRRGPRAQLPGGAMADVLRMAAGELRHPVPLRVLMEAGDGGRGHGDQPGRSTRPSAWRANRPSCRG